MWNRSIRLFCRYVFSYAYFTVTPADKANYERVDDDTMLRLLSQRTAKGGLRVREVDVTKFWYPTFSKRFCVSDLR
jgi:hypothetical protein